MHIAITTGSAYVGLVTETCFAETGVEVYCDDSDTGKIKQLRQGEILAANSDCGRPSHATSGRTPVLSIRDPTSTRKLPPAPPRFSLRRLSGHEDGHRTLHAERTAVPAPNRQPKHQPSVGSLQDILQIRPADS
ncbi:hypothetical protein [uncultured Alistipes sp.]|uniref:hypothetical protein n=1 Tax=uncultured Alistipes sp. TaxID=538949 RepID=UPI0035A5FEF8